MATWGAHRRRRSGDHDHDPWSTDTNTWSRQPFPGNVLPQNPAKPMYKVSDRGYAVPTLPNVNPMPAELRRHIFPVQPELTTAVPASTSGFSNKDTFYGPLLAGQYSNRSQFYGLPSLDWSKVPGNTQGSFQPNKSFALSHVRTFSPTFFNELLVTGTRTRDVLTGDPTVCYDCALGLPNPFNVNSGRALRPGFNATCC